VAAFNQGLRKIGERLLHRPLGDVAGLAFPTDTRAGAAPAGGGDPARRRYSAKVGLATTLAYIVGVASHRSELGAAVWTALIAGMPTYGATLRKMILRIVGGVIGGLLALPVMLVVSPNFESLGAYLAAFFVVLFLCAYLSLSSGRLACGPAGWCLFYLAYAALPKRQLMSRCGASGVFLGLLIVTAVFLLVAPGTRARRSPRLQAILSAPWSCRARRRT
jgi:uncharacterized membrane protein YccC